MKSPETADTAITPKTRVIEVEGDSPRGWPSHSDRISAVMKAADDLLQNKPVEDKPFYTGEYRPGDKHDQAKPNWFLLPLRPVGFIVEVLTFGAKKYAPDGWKLVPNGRERYYSAAMRHIAAWQGGEWLDHESKCPHLAHAACCLIFVMWFDWKDGKYGG